MLQTPPSGPGSRPKPPALEGATRSAANWFGQFARTVKISRLYDVRNPTVVRFREQLVESLRALLDEHGTLDLTFTSREVLVGEVAVHAAESRDDNLALPFFRDGIRRLSFAPGIEEREIVALLDAVLRVTQRDADLEDLVTLLWDAELAHVGMEYVSTEADAETGESGAAAEGTLAPWPAHGSSGVPAGGVTDGATRSDDHDLPEVAGDLDKAWAAIDAAAPAETERFRCEFARSEAEPPAGRAFALLHDCLTPESDPGARIELGRYLPRVLHESLGGGAWNQAREILALVRASSPDGWSAGALAAQLCGEGSITARHALAQLECQAPEEVASFGAFATELGSEGFDWVMSVIATSERQHVRRPLTRVAAALLAGRPEKLARWLADDRWYVVRNAVHVLGWTQAPPLHLLDAVKDHPEPRVRREVVAVASKHPSPDALGLVLHVLRGADGRLLVAVLQQVGRRRDPRLARALVDMLHAPKVTRPEGETRALYLALSGAGDESVLPDLEADIQNGSWIAAGDDARRFAAAMCVARMAGEAARSVLERGAASRRANVARACREALASRDRAAAPEDLREAA